MIARNRVLAEKKYTSSSEATASEGSCVFIAHQKQDRTEATAIADYILEQGVDVYYDENDENLRKHYREGNAQGITEAICNGINNSSHMLVVVSPATLNSSWVPFEIGYGYEKTQVYILCLKGIKDKDLPEYMKCTPIIRDIKGLEKFILSIRDKTPEKNENELYSQLVSVMDDNLSE